MWIDDDASRHFVLLSFTRWECVLKRTFSITNGRLSSSPCILLDKIKLVGRSYIHQFQMAITIRKWRQFFCLKMGKLIGFHCESPSRLKVFFIHSGSFGSANHQRFVTFCFWKRKIYIFILNRKSDEIKHVFIHEIIIFGGEKMCVRLRHAWKLIVAKLFPLIHFSSTLSHFKYGRVER